MQRFGDEEFLSKHIITPNNDKQQVKENEELLKEIVSFLPLYTEVQKILTDADPITNADATPNLKARAFVDYMILANNLIRVAVQSSEFTSAKTQGQESVGDFLQNNAYLELLKAVDTFQGYYDAPAISNAVQPKVNSNTK